MDFRLGPLTWTWIVTILTAHIKWHVQQVCDDVMMRCCQSVGISVCMTGDQMIHSTLCIITNN